jgi:hypothetical protein
MGTKVMLLLLSLARKCRYRASMKNAVFGATASSQPTPAFHDFCQSVVVFLSATVPAK